LFGAFTGKGSRVLSVIAVYVPPFTYPMLIFKLGGVVVYLGVIVISKTHTPATIAEGRTVRVSYHTRASVDRVPSRFSVVGVSTLGTGFKSKYP
jgi:hypothetical protein